MSTQYEKSLYGNILNSSPQLITIGGRPAIGKTSLALQLAQNSNDPNNVLFFSFETKNVQFLNDPDGKLKGFNISALTNVDDIEYVIKAQTESFSLIIIDYLQIIAGSCNQISGEANNEYVLKKLKNISIELNINIILLSQLARPVDESKLKTVNDFRLESLVSIKEFSDVIILINRNFNNSNEDRSKAILEIFPKDGCSEKIDVSWDDSTRSFYKDKPIKMYNRTKYLLPAYESIVQTELDPVSYIRLIIEEGLENMIPNFRSNEKYVLRLENELAVIVERSLIEPLLIFYDYFQFAKSENIKMGSGRGFLSASLISFSLGISDIDPVKNDLVFELSINESTSIPSFAIDFELGGRARIRSYLVKKYGSSCVLDIIAYGRHWAKSALGEALSEENVNSSLTNKILNLIPIEFNITLDTAIHRSKELYDFSNLPNLKKNFERAFLLEGIIAKKSCHASGVVIINKASITLVPIEKNVEKDFIVLVEAKDLEKFKLAKFDCCELAVLSRLKEVETIIKTKLPSFNLNTINLEDSKVYNFLMNTGNEMKGIFQLESSVALNFFRCLSPSSLDDIANFVGLYRPWPLESGMVDKYIINKNTSSYIFPIKELQHILNLTYGQIIFKEQIVHILNQFVGFSLEEAVHFVQVDNGYGNKIDLKLFEESAVSDSTLSKHDQEIIVAMINSSRFAFLKSHALTYAILTYQCAYLSYYFPSEWGEYSLE